MINFNLQYQLNIFGDFRDIDVSPDCTIKLLQLYKEHQFIPSNFQEMNAPVMLSNVPFLIRPMLTTINNEWSISIGSQRIDIVKNPVDNTGENMGSIEKFASSAVEFISIIFSNFDKKANRIALNTTALLDDLKEQKLDAAYNSLINGIDYYQIHKPTEWNVSSTARIHENINGSKEVINVISNVARAQGRLVTESVDTYRLNLAFDINTAPNNTRERIDSNAVKQFLDHAIRNRALIINELGGILYGVYKSVKR